MMKLKRQTRFHRDGAPAVEATKMMKMPDKGDSFLLEVCSLKAIHPHADIASGSRLSLSLL